MTAVCGPCERAGRYNAARFIVTVYTGQAEHSTAACTPHAMAAAATALAEGHGVWALCASREETHAPLPATSGEAVEAPPTSRVARLLHKVRRAMLRRAA